MTTVYPTTIDTYVARSDGPGNIIWADYVNTLLGAVVAAETKLGMDDSYPTQYAMLQGTDIYHSSWTVTPTTGALTLTVTGALGGLVVSDVRLYRGEANAWYTDSGDNLLVQGTTVLGGSTAPSTIVSNQSVILKGVHTSGVLNIYGLNNQYSVNQDADLGGVFYGYYGGHTFTLGAGHSLTNYIGSFLAVPTVVSGSIANAYGYYVAALSQGTTSNTGIYVAAPSGSASDIGIRIAGGDIGLQVDAGGITVTGASTITGTLGGLTGLTMAGNIVMGGDTTIGQAAGPLIAFDDANNYLEITGCNVGIGTTAPSQLLHLYKASGATKLLIQSAGSDSTAYANLTFNSGSVSVDNTFGAINWQRNGVDMGSIYMAPSDITGGSEDAFMTFNTALNGAFGERVRITSEGKVGIGTTIPGSYNVNANNLVVGVSTGTGANYGITIASDATGTSNLLFAKGTTGSQQYQGSVEYSHAVVDANSFMKFNVAGSGKVKFFGSGGVFIGTGAGTDSGAGTLTTAAGITAQSGGINVTGNSTITATNAAAFGVGPNGSTNPTFRVDTSFSPGTLVTGLEVYGVGSPTTMIALRAIGAGANVALLIEGKGAGSIQFGNVSTGDITSVRLHVFSAGINVTGGSRVTGGTLDLGTAGSSLGVLEFNGNTSGTITVQSAAAAGTWTLTLPPDDGDAGEQLQTNGSGVTTWEAAGSLRQFKHILGRLDPREGLARILAVPVYEFQYWRSEPGGPRLSTTGDYETRYSGVLGDEAPWAMHHGGRIFSPVSAFGHTVMAIQALATQLQDRTCELAAALAHLDVLEQRLTALPGGGGIN